MIECTYIHCVLITDKKMGVRSSIMPYSSVFLERAFTYTTQIRRQHCKLLETKTGEPCRQRVK